MTPTTKDMIVNRTDAEVISAKNIHRLNVQRKATEMNMKAQPPRYAIANTRKIIIAGFDSRLTANQPCDRGYTESKYNAKK